MFMEVRPGFFSNLTPGTYGITFITPTGYSPTLSNVGSDDTKDSDPVGGTVTGIVLSLGQTNNTVDAGFIPSILSLGNRVWYDTNNDGINNSSENGIANITVKLYNDNDNNNIADGAAIATKTTFVPIKGVTEETSPFLMARKVVKFPRKKIRDTIAGCQMKFQLTACFSKKNKGRNTSEMHKLVK